MLRTHRGAFRVPIIGIYGYECERKERDWRKLSGTKEARNERGRTPKNRSHLTLPPIGLLLFFSLIQIRSVLDQIQGCRKVRSDFDETFFLISSQRIRSMCFGCFGVRGCIKNSNRVFIVFSTLQETGGEREPFREVRHCVEYFSPVERYASSFSASVKSFCLSMAYRRRRRKTHVVVVGVSRINIPNPITFPTLEPVLRHRKI